MSTTIAHHQTSLRLGNAEGNAYYIPSPHSPTRKIALFSHGHAGRAGGNGCLKPVQETLFEEGWSLLFINRAGSPTPDGSREIDDRMYTALCFLRNALSWALREKISAAPCSDPQAGFDAILQTARPSQQTAHQTPVLFVGFSEGCNVNMLELHNWAAYLTWPLKETRKHLAEYFRLQGNRLRVCGAMNFSPVDEVGVFRGKDAVLHERFIKTLSFYLKKRYIHPSDPVSSYLYLFPDLLPPVKEYLDEWTMSLGRYLEVTKENGAYDYFPWRNGELIFNPLGVPTINIVGNDDFFAQPFQTLFQSYLSPQSATPGQNQLFVTQGGHQLEGATPGFLQAITREFCSRALDSFAQPINQVRIPQSGVGIGGVDHIL